MLSGNFWTSKALKGDKELTSEVFNWSQPAKNKKKIENFKTWFDTKWTFIGDKFD